MIAPSFDASIPKLAAFCTNVIPLFSSSLVSCNSAPVNDNVSIPTTAAIEPVKSFVSEFVFSPSNTAL